MQIKKHLYTHLTIMQTCDLLSNAGCKVYIDPGNGSPDDTAISDYGNAQMYVNGSMENTSYGQYEFPLLATALNQ